MTAPASSAALGAGCLVLFMLPFAITGAVTFVRALGHASAGEWEQAAGLGIFGLVFGLVGFGGIYAALRARRLAGEVEASRARNPDAPWLWRRDWAERRILDGNRGTMIAAWIFAGFWNLVSLPAAVLGIREALEEGNRAALLALVFPLVGLGLLVWAVRATLRYRRFGISRLELATLPAAVGRELRGTVVAPVLLDAREAVDVTLTCVRRVTRGSGKNRSTSETVLWQEEQRAPVSPSRTGEGMVTTIPIALRIPADAEPADQTDSRNQVIWRLAVSAEVPGVDYNAGFEVPVFRTGEAPLANGVEPTSAPAVSEPFSPPADSRIKVTRNRRGTEILFPAGRNAGVSAGITGFLAIWLAAVWATVHLDAPFIFQAVFAGFGVLLVWIAVASWFGVSRVTVGDGNVTVAKGLFAPRHERQMAAPEVAEVVTRIGMQAGGRPYYDLILVTKQGRKVPAGRGIRDKREAEWLAETLREALRPD